MISKRTKDSLALARKRGVKLGGRRRKVIGKDSKGRPVYGQIANGSARRVRRLRQPHSSALMAGLPDPPRPSASYRRTALRRYAPLLTVSTSKASRRRAVAGRGLPCRSRAFLNGSDRPPVNPKATLRSRVRPLTDSSLNKNRALYVSRLRPTCHHQPK
jgi:hypothetical protein